MRTASRQRRRRRNVVKRSMRNTGISCKGRLKSRGAPSGCQRDYAFSRGILCAASPRGGRQAVRPLRGWGVSAARRGMRHHRRPAGR
jgi:hypothetical protein